MIDCALAAKFCFNWFDRKTIRFNGAIAATLADQIIDHNSLCGIRERTALATATWGEFLGTPGPITCPGNGRWAEIEVRFYATGTSASPVLYDLTLTWSTSGATGP